MLILKQNQNKTVKEKKMKRLLIFIMAMLTLSLPLNSLAAGDINQTAEFCTYENKDTVLPYRLILPEGYDAEKTYPLIFFFHGAGERGNDNKLQFFHCVQYLADQLPECIIVAPQCPLNNQWVDTPWVKGAYSVDNVPESNEMKAVIELLEELKGKYSVDTDRIYASGISMGGFGVWDVMMRHNDIFAAGIAVCGGGDVSKGELLKDTPLFVFHGDADTAVPVTGSRDTVQAIKNAGGTLVEYVEYKGAGHGIWNDAFKTEGLLEKLLECKLSDRYPTEESSEPVPESETETEAASPDAAEESKGLSLPVIIAIIAAVAIPVAMIIFLLVIKRK